MAEEEFEGTGLPPSLGFIVMTVNARPGITAGEIAVILQLQPSTVTRLVDKLEERGFLTRQTAGKFMHVYPTTRGARLEEHLQSAWKKLYRRYAEILGEERSMELTSAIVDAGDRLEAE
jgi:DNA-binding MarR family transcriptional regulator